MLSKKGGEEQQADGGLPPGPPLLEGLHSRPNGIDSGKSFARSPRILLTPRPGRQMSEEESAMRAMREEVSATSAVLSLLLIPALKEVILSLETVP